MWGIPIIKGLILSFGADAVRLNGGETRLPCGPHDGTFMSMVENWSRRRPLWQCSEVTAKLCHSARVSSSEEISFVAEHHVLMPRG